jgi:hypothetical protein
VARDEAERAVEAVGLGPPLVARELDHAAALLARNRDERLEEPPPEPFAAPPEDTRTASICARFMPRRERPGIVVSWAQPATSPAISIT